MVNLTRGWSDLATGPTATGAQRARRRSVDADRALVLSRTPPDAALVAAMEAAGLAMEWTASGPAAVSEVLAGNVAVCVVVAGRRNSEGVDFLPCINQINPLLPVIVLSDADSIELQRRIRACKVFYYFVGPLEGDEAREVFRAALHQAAPGEG